MKIFVALTASIHNRVYVIKEENYKVFSYDNVAVVYDRDFTAFLYGTPKSCSLSFMTRVPLVVYIPGL